MADLFIIGQFNGVDSTTAVSVGSQVMHMLTVMIVGLAMGSTVLIGKTVGAKRKEETSATRYEKLNGYISEHHMEISGGSTEITMIDYGYTNDPDKFVTEIQIPVVRNKK